MLEIIIDNKNGNLWDISGIVSNLTWKTSRIGKASSVDITLIKGGIYENGNVSYNNGDIVSIRFNNHNVFHGYIFDVARGMDEAVSIKAYDQLRYLMYKDTYVFTNVTATQIMKQIADDVGLQYSTLADTGYTIPSLLEDNQTLMDMVWKALTLTLINTGRNYVLYDDFGQLTIRNIEDLQYDFYIGEGSLMYDYEYKQSIDSDTYNRVKVVQDNQDTGRRDVYIAQDSANIAKWGRLQLYEVAQENMNPAQIKAMVDQLITLKNRETRSLKISALGDIRVRAGSYLHLIIEELGINQPFLVDECSHSISGADHTMTLELKVI